MIQYYFAMVIRTEQKIFDYEFTPKFHHTTL